MKIFIDSANPDDVKRCAAFSFVGGVTTTPTILAKHRRGDTRRLLEELSGLVDELHVEAMGDTVEQIIEVASGIADYGIGDKLVFKIPISSHGIVACRTLVAKGYRVNIHLVYSLAQAYFAASEGATYICLLVGRLLENNLDAGNFIAECRELLDARGYSSKLMAGSIRERRHLDIALLAGVDCAAVPPKVIEASFGHCLTEAGVEQFKRDLASLS